MLLGATALSAVAGFTAAVVTSSQSPKKSPKDETPSRTYADNIAARGAVMALAKSAIAGHILAGTDSQTAMIAASERYVSEHFALIDKTLAGIENGGEFRDNLIRDLKRLKESCAHDDRALASFAYNVTRYAELPLADDDIHLRMSRDNKGLLLPYVEKGFDAVIAHLRDLEIAKPVAKGRIP